MRAEVSAADMEMLLHLASKLELNDTGMLIICTASGSLSRTKALRSWRSSKQPWGTLQHPDPWPGIVFHLSSHLALQQGRHGGPKASQDVLEGSLRRQLGPLGSSGSWRRLHAGAQHSQQPLQAVAAGLGLDGGLSRACCCKLCHFDLHLKPDK